MDKIKAANVEYSKLIEDLHVYEDKVGIIPKEVFDSAYKKAEDNEALETLRERVEFYGVPWQSRRALFSAALPQGFYYDNHDVQIKNGVLLTGTIDKKTIGNTDNSIIAEIVKKIGAYTAIRFHVNNVQFILYDYLDSIGI